LFPFRLNMGLEERRGLGRADGLETIMSMPFARYGVRELIVGSALLTLAFLASLWIFVWLAPVFLALLGLVVWFFRDPERRVPDEANILLAPADGRVVEISQVDEPDFIGGPAVKIGIFLSIFDVHLNRAPCRGQVAYLRYQPGQFKNALRQAAARLNESNSIGIEADGRFGRVLVKQIAGAIARRIVCECKLDDVLEAGQKFGMIKLGSRTEVYFPAASEVRLRVKVGDKVLAGETILGAAK